jgi:hypothetical protein
MAMRGILVEGKVVFVDAADVLRRLERGEKVSLLKAQIEALLSARSPWSHERQAELRQQVASGAVRVVDR